MGKRGPKTQNKLVVLGIFLACCFALYCLILKINRLMEIAEMDRTAASEAIITSVIYLNSSFSGESSASIKFLIHSQNEPPTDLFCDSRNPVGKLTSPVTTQLIGSSRIYLGTCDVLEPGFSVELKNEEFSATLDPELSPPRRHSAVCLSLALLFEDIASLKILLKHYSKSAEIVEIYVSSWHDSAFKVAEKYPNVHVIYWPLLQSLRRTQKVYSRINLDSDSYKQTLETSFADCWLRNGPLVEKISLIELGGFEFAAGSQEKFGGDMELLKEEWRVEKIIRGKVEKITEHSLKISETCIGRDCNKPSSTGDKLTGNSTTILKRIEAIEDGIQIENSYLEDIKRCTNFKGYSSKVRKLMKKTIGSKNLPDPCLIRSYREDFRCRVASQMTKRLFSNGVKVSVVQKRSMLRYSDGCR